MKILSVLKDTRNLPLRRRKSLGLALAVNALALIWVIKENQCIPPPWRWFSRSENQFND